ncbi:hypothetical protein ACP4OV_007473 [Aristida adscensionis]
MASSSGAADTLVHVAFNSTATHFVAATATGIRVFACNPLRHVYSKSGFDTAGEVTCADLVPAGPLVVAVVFREPPAAAAAAAADDDGCGQGDYKVRYWNELYCEMMPRMSPSCRGAVRAVLHAGGHAAVAGEDRVTLHETSRHAVRRAGEFDTGPNPLGVCALAAANGGGGGGAFVLACPRPARGEVQVRRGGRGGRVDVPAHRACIACVALSRDGRLLATASSKGTVVRVFSTADGKKLQELRRGKDRADIHCMVFSPDSMWLAVSSDKATIHVFRINLESTSLAPGEDGDGLQEAAATPAATATDKQGSYLSFFTGFVPGYLKLSKAECSLAKFRLRQGVKYMVAFGREPYTVLIIGMDGSFYRCQFDPVKAGDMKQLEYRNFMNIK